MNRYRKLEKRLALPRYQSSSCVGIIPADGAGNSRKVVWERQQKEKKTKGEEGGAGGGGEGREVRGKSARPQGHEAITKLQKLTIKPDRHTGATIKLAGRPADRRIFLAFTTNHVAMRRT